MKWRWMRVFASQYHPIEDESRDGHGPRIDIIYFIWFEFFLPFGAFIVIGSTTSLTGPETNEK